MLDNSRSQITQDQILLGYDMTEKKSAEINNFCSSSN